MNRRTNIIVCLVGIFIVLLALIGITFAYFLTKIKGNSSDKSISVTTANLELTYGEESNEIIIKSNLIPGEEIATKKFSATNNGTSKVNYVVTLENVVNKFTRKEDVVYTLKCTSNDGSYCNEISEETIFPSTETSVVIGNEIASGVTHNYTLIIRYKEIGADQSIDMNKTLSAKVNIADPNAVNPYTGNKKLLAYNIINNAATKKNGTDLLASPVTIPAQETSERFNEIGTEVPNQINISITTQYQNYYWTYGTGYKIDKLTGKITLTGVSTCKYNEGKCYSKIKGNYLISARASDNSSNTNSQLSRTSNLFSIYKVVEVPQPSSSEIIMKAVMVTPDKISAENTMSTFQDDYGTSYYYRGDVKDNYLELNNMCFRIVRIEGDGSIKITLAKENKCLTITDSDTQTALINGGAKNMKYGVDNSTGKDLFNYEGYTGEDGMYVNLNNWYNNKLKAVESKLKEENWCLGGKASKYHRQLGIVIKNTYSGVYYNYETGMRIFGQLQDSYNTITRSSTYKCSLEADTVKGYVGALTADELVFAGAAAKAVDDGKTQTIIGNNANPTFYLNDNAHVAYWLLSRSSTSENRDFAFAVKSNGTLTDNVIYNTLAVRPAVTIATGAELVSGDGTIENPYIIK